MTPPPTEVFASRLFLGPALRAQPDRRLVTLVREGYETAFEEIVRRYGRPLARYAASIVGSRSEDVTQDAFSKALVALRRDDNEIELRPWLYRIVRNTALNDLRDSPPTSEILEEAIAAGRGTAAEAEDREELRELIERLKALPERQRAAIVMRELEGLSHGEIAAALGLSGGAARQAIFRAREAVRSGAAILVPLPLMRLLLDYGPEATAGAGLVAAGGGAGGAGTALKASAVAAILAGSVGTGIALQQDHGKGDQADAASLSALKLPGKATGSTIRPEKITDDSGAGREAGDVGSGDRGHGSSGQDNGRGHAAGDNSSTRAQTGGGSRNSGPGSVGATSGPSSGRGESGSGDRHGGGSGGPGESSGPGSGGEGTNDGSSPGSSISGGTDDHSGPSGGETDGQSSSGSGSEVDHSGSDDGLRATEHVSAPEGSGGGGDGSSSSDGSGGKLEPGSEVSHSGRDSGGGESAPPPAS
jgi:RNA polymerase sigma factor (sigma-70 family)